jgi:hypothetical protein
MAKKHSPTDPLPVVFTLNDVFAETNDKFRVYRTNLASLDPEDISQMFLTWYTQKNKQNGETLNYSHSSSDGQCDCVCPLLRIIKRFVDIHGLTNLVSPLAIYADPSVGPSSARLINSRDIETSMRLLASVVYHLDPVLYQSAWVGGARTHCKLVHVLSYNYHKSPCD